MSDLLNPNNYGVLPTGFSRMRLPEIRQTIIDSLTNRLGIPFETRPDSITGQFIDTFAEREATMWELAEAVYHAMYPISATGINLDHAVSFSGVRRLFAERSNAWAVLYGDETTIIPTDAIVRSQNTQDNFLLQDPVTISRQNASDATISIDTVVVGQEYWISINSVIYRYTPISGDTALVIATELYTQLLASSLELVLNANQIQMNTLESIPFALQISTNISLVTIGSPGVFIAENYGPIDVSAGSLTMIISTQTGWNDVNNLVDGHLGRDLETDDELRARYDQGVFILGAATLESIRATLQQNVAGLISLEVYENKTDDVDSEGRPPHSIEVIAYGGDPMDIATQIWLTKAAGIDTFGSVTVSVTDSVGYRHDISFNRPTPIYIWVDIQVTLYNEEIFPDNGVQLIQAVVAATGNTFGIGKDVIVQRLYGPIYNAVSGIGKMDITVASETDPNVTPAPGDYVPDNIAIAARELSQFDMTHVSVTILP